MNRTELQQIAQERAGDAELLLANRRWSAAYYLMGYAVEAGLKSCILKFVDETGVVFTDRKFAEKCWTHDFGNLLKQANLEPILGAEIAANPRLDANWSTVRLWSEVSRHQVKSEIESRSLCNAVTEPIDGVLAWIQRYW